MNYLHAFIGFALITLFISSCSDNPADAEKEIILYEDDSIMLSSTDSVKFISSNLVGFQHLTGHKKYGLSFTASTNDSSAFSHLKARVFTCKEPICTPPTINHIDESYSGSGINISYSKTFVVERSDEYGILPVLSISFDTTYNTPGKYIILRNIRFSRYDN